jgi:hypothetical protein
MFIVTEKYTDPVMALAIHAVKRLDENEKKKALFYFLPLCSVLGGLKQSLLFLQVISIVFQLLCILLNDKKLESSLCHNDRT